MFDITELPPETPLSIHTIEQFFSEQSREIIAAYVQECIHQYKSFSVEVPLYTTKKRERWIKLQAEHIIEDEKHYIFGTFQDITDRVRAEQALRESEARFRTLFDSAPSGMVLIDQDMKILKANREFCKLFGYEEKELQGKTPFYFTHPDDIKQSHQFASDLYEKSGQPLQIEKRYIRKNGETLHSLVRSVALSEGGEKSYLLSHLIDITEKKEREKEQEQLQAKALELQHLEGLALLAGGFAHDFNNILSSILCNADLAQIQANRAELDDHLEKIIQSTQKASELCQQLLAYSGKGKFLLQKVNLSEVIHEVLHFLSISLPRSVRLENLLQYNLPLFEADANQLRMLVINVVTNAIDALEQKEGTVTISTGYTSKIDPPVTSTSFIEMPKEGPHVYLEVQDTGCGIDEKLWNKIFTPFYTTKSTNRGLGLSAVLGIMRSYQGGIFLDSSIQKGTTMRLYFPTHGEYQRTSIIPSKAPGLSSNTKTVLFVDDDQSIQEVGHQILKRARYQVLSAEDGEEGVKLFEQNHAILDAVILDLTMPKMGGIEASGIMRKIDRDVPILFSSGYTDKELRARTEEDPHTSFLQKPYRPRDLLRKLRELTDRRAHDRR
ncbi:MAG: PAS domain S-box protein [Myxococcales bacterium]|nr:PAS domain S-box protein [Myxococcales bacterium]